MARKPEQAKSAIDGAGKSSPELVNDEIAQEIERQIGPLISGKQREQVVARVLGVVYNERFSGPMPHPKHFQEYEDILPGAAERILSMAENAQDHNRQMEGKIVEAQIRDQKRGMYVGFAALMVIIGVAAVLAAVGNNIGAGAFLTTAVLGAVGAFIKGRF